MMTDRDNEISHAAGEHSNNSDNRISFICGVRWADRYPNAVSKGYLQNWYQDSVDETKSPVWTDKHLEELYNDFYLIPKEEEENSSTKERKESEERYVKLFNDCLIKFTAAILSNPASVDWTHEAITEMATKQTDIVLKKTKNV